MDPNRNNESRDRRREEALARRLGEALDRAAPQETEPCPDAEWIAAYHERALAPNETAQCEAHFAACSRCRKILAVLAASDETPLAEIEVARLGELVAAAQAPRQAATQIAKPARPSQWDWRARWLAPALGVAAVLAMWFAIRPPWRVPEQNSPGTLIAQAPKTEPPPIEEPLAPPVDQFSKAVPVQKPGTGSAISSGASRERSLSKTESPRPAADSLAKNLTDNGGAMGGLVPSAGFARNASEDQKKENADSAMATVQGQAPALQAHAAPPVAAPSLQTEVQEMSRPAQAETRGGVNAPMRALKGPSARAAAPSNSDSIDGSNVIAGPGSGMFTPGLLKSPSGAVSWRIGANGRIERSTDTGRTWLLQASPSVQEWLSGIAVSDTTCWIVGRNGAIARTTDGEHWGQIAPPPMASAASGKFPDWIGVTAAGAQTATITANNQQRYATQDGGKTWRAQ